jgi:lysophospholipase L1-like esterase
LKPAYFVGRLPLEDQLARTASRVVIWLGGNDFRAGYGTIYGGGSSAALISGLNSNLSRIINFVRQWNPRAQIVLVNVPDLGATPAKKAAHPDPLKRARVTAATQAANQLIASLAAQKGIPVANSYGLTANLIKGVRYYFGAVEIVNDMEADNNPRYAFTRDGLHPNTASQIRNARAIISAFNAGYNAGIPQITDAEALTLLHINPNQPYYDWLAGYGITNRSFIDDADGDGIPPFVEYALGLNPTVPDAGKLPVTLGGPVAGYSGNVSVQCTPDPTRRRMARVRVQYSTDLVTWRGVPATNVRTNAAGAFTAVVPPTSTKAYVRLKVSTVPPSGSTVSVYSVLRLN